MAEHGTVWLNAQLGLDQWGRTKELAYNTLRSLEHIIIGQQSNTITSMLARIAALEQSLQKVNPNGGAIPETPPITPDVSLKVPLLNPSTALTHDNPLYSTASTPVQGWTTSGVSQSGGVPEGAPTPNPNWYYRAEPSQPAFIPPIRNFTFDGRPLPYYGNPQLPATNQGTTAVVPAMRWPPRAPGYPPAGNFVPPRGIVPSSRPLLPPNPIEGQNNQLQHIDGVQTQAIPTPVNVQLVSAIANTPPIANPLPNNNQRFVGYGQQEAVPRIMPRRVPTVEEILEEQQWIEYEANEAQNRAKARNNARRREARNPQRKNQPEALLYQENSNRMVLCVKKELHLCLPQRQKLGETAEAYLTRFRPMHAKIPGAISGKYEESTIVKMAISGIQDFKLKLAVTPHLIRSLAQLMEVVHNTEKVIRAKRESKPTKSKSWFHKEATAEVNNIAWNSSDDEDRPWDNVNVAEIINLKEYTCCLQCDTILGGFKHQLTELEQRFSGHYHQPVSQQEVTIMVDGRPQTWVHKPAPGEILQNHLQQQTFHNHPQAPPQLLQVFQTGFQSAGVPVPACRHMSPVHVPAPQIPAHMRDNRLPSKKSSEFAVMDDAPLDLELAQALRKRDAIQRVLKFFEAGRKFKAEHLEVNWEDVIYDVDPETDNDVVELNELTVVADKLEDGSMATKDPVITAEYEGLIYDLRALIHNGARNVKVISNSALVVGRMKNTMKRKDDILSQYAALEDELQSHIDKITFTNVLHPDNHEANAMAQSASDYVLEVNPSWQYDIVKFDFPAYHEQAAVPVHTIQPQVDAGDWRRPILHFLLNLETPTNIQTRSWATQ
ncbi:OLC1v1001710C1 [Oldenlandia corymbosa var. corymbosa]|uniref:OLC1v1001710C1 n=1 Tax=Oldenlandia corymbosa var. corymbosa TaxID=529605 RepID=A0AAV1D5W6_OLDCO|nr:OLC1v1001710C1 [Oldenlandia corymbosa var. corymbosa]